MRQITEENIDNAIRMAKAGSGMEHAFMEIHWKWHTLDIGIGESQ